MTDNPDMISPEDFAELVDVNPKTIYRNLQADLEKPEDEGRLPGAYKIGTNEDQGSAWIFDLRE
jgi:hypothetical protein